MGKELSIKNVKMETKIVVTDVLFLVVKLKKDLFVKNKEIILLIYVFVNKNYIKIYV
jgi:hypothetical protein